MQFNNDRITYLKPPKQFKVVKYFFLNTFRISDNFGFQLALELAKKNQAHLEIYYSTKALRIYNDRQKEQIKKRLKYLKDLLHQHNYSIFEYTQTTNDVNELRISDFPYLKTEKHLIKNHFQADIIVESNIFVPVQIAAPNAQIAARTIRPKINKVLETYIEKATPIFENSIDSEVATKIKHLVQTILPNYLDSSNPNFNYCSNLSGEMAIGTVPLFHLYNEIVSSDADPEAIAAFLEQLIIRRELAINHCFYTLDYDQLGNWVPSFVKSNILNVQKSEYTIQQIENAQTADPYWNLAQQELIKHGHIHNYMRMYWGKKIIEWSSDYTTAHTLMIKLNNTYAFDGNCPNSYAGINWCFGLHDRPFQNREWFGTLRYMNESGIKRKFKNLEQYAIRINGK